MLAPGSGAKCIHPMHSMDAQSCRKPDELYLDVSASNAVLVVAAAASTWLTLCSTSLTFSCKHTWNCSIMDSLRCRRWLRCDIKSGHGVLWHDVCDANNDTDAIRRRQVGINMAGCIAYYAKLATAFDHF